MNVSHIEVGKYYRTENNQHRHVTGIDGGKVSYKSRGQKGGDWNFGHNKSSPPTLEKFAADVVEEVGADWQSE